MSSHISPYRLTLSLTVALALVTALRPSAATLPSGFTESIVASGLTAPVTMQFAPDGRLFVLEQAGTVRVIQNGTLLPTPFISLSVASGGDRGLLGIAFDPLFATEPWVYLSYTVATPSPHNVVARVLANGNVASGAPQIIFELENLGESVFHNAGALAFGPVDGKLYVAVGENFQPQLAQDMTRLFGKMLRINRDGTIPSDNPFYNTATGPARAIWALGLRNPYNFTFNPGGTPAMLINDVGEQRWEEINEGVAGANYGWPLKEGPEESGPPDPAFRYPLFAYFHGQGCAIIGAAVYSPATLTFPPEYHGKMFFADYCGITFNTADSWIATIDPASPPPTTQGTFPRFATGLVAPVDVRIGDDGALYYLERPSSGSTGAVYRVQYGSGGPGITTHPANQTVGIGQPVTFSVTASGSNLSYQWQRNQTDIAGATGATYSFTAQAVDDGARFRVRVTNPGGSILSNEALLTVTANQAPVATITLPAPGATYGGGQTITYAATATDAEDGPLPGSAFTWWVDFHHDDHIHPFRPPTSGATGDTFVVPTTGHSETTVWYRIHLTVRDSHGMEHSVFRDVVPRVVQLTLTTEPVGRPLLLDSQPIATPHVAPSVEGVIRNIEAQNHTEGSIAYTFTGWSDGGAARHDIVTPAENTTYTATFGTATAAPTAFTLSANGATLTATWNRVGGATSYRLEVGSAAGLNDLLTLDVGDIAFIQGAVPVGTYFARVRAIHTSGISGPSNEGSAQVTTGAACVSPPPVPANYVARAGGLTAGLSWLPSAAATVYVLEVGSQAGASDLLITNLGNVTSVVATAPAGTYFTRIRAANACGVSDPTAEAPVVLACTPDAVVPTGLTVSKSGGIATFAWQAPLGATGYRLQVGSVPGVTNLLDADIGTDTSLSVPLGDVVPGLYYVRVAATSACGVGSPSNEVTVQVP